MALEGITSLFVVVPAIAPCLAVIRRDGNHFNEPLETLESLRDGQSQVNQHIIGLAFQCRGQRRVGQGDVVTVAGPVDALVDLAAKVQTGELPAASAKAIARASFPLISDAILNGIFDGIKPQPPQNTTP